MYTFKNNFTSGELAPDTLCRADLLQYKNGAYIMENTLPKPQGGCKRRPGSVFVARAKFNNRTARLIPFKFSVTQSYMLEVGHQYMRFFSNQGRLEEAAQNIEDINDNGSGLIRVTITGHGYSTDEYIAIRGVTGTTEANDDWKITVIDPDTFDLQSSSFDNTYVSGGTAREIIEIAAPWDEDELPDIRFAQDADLMFMVHPDNWPYLLKRTAATTFTLTQIDNVVSASEERWKAGPFAGDNIDESLTMTWGGATTVTTSDTMTASSAYFTNDMIGMYFKYAGEVSNVQGYLRITAVGSSTPITTATMVVESALSAATATASWALGAWGTFNGFPKDVTFFEQRLLFAGSDAEPQTGWGSQTGSIFDFHVGTDDDEPVVFTVAAEDVNVIQWIAAHDALLVGTQGAEYAVKGGSNAALSPTNILARQQSSFGSEPIRAIKIGSSILYVQRAGRRVRDLNFSLDEDRFLTDDITLLADHIFDDDPIIDGAFQLSPDPVVWFVTEAGILASLTIIKSQQVLAWARHTITDTEVESVGVVPRTTVDNDDVWLIGKITVNGGEKRYIGYLDKNMRADWGLAGAFGSPVATITGIDHLEGKTVVINGDGAVYPARVVEGGAISTTSGEPGITDVFLGLAFTPRVVPTSPEFEMPQGPSFGQRKRFNKVLVIARNTMTLSLNGETKEARSTEDDMDTAPVIQNTGIFQFTTLGNFEIIEMEITQPLPIDMNILAVYGEVEISA